MKKLLLLMLCCPVLLPAQQSNGITISDFSATVGSPTTVTFEVRWTRSASSKDSAWIFLDYNDRGTMTRLSLETGGHTSSAGTVTVSGNQQGVWLVTDTPASGEFSSRVTLLSVNNYLAGACVYAVNYFPKGRYTSASTVVFNGTPKYDVVLQQAGSISKVESPYKIPDGDALLSFTDATGAPGTISCLPPNPQTLVALPSYCEGVSGVDISLANTQKGVIYELINEQSKAVVATRNGLDDGAGVSFGTHGAGSYSVRSKAEGAFCAIAVSGTHTVTEIATPATPGITASAATVCQNGALTFYVASPVANATYTWTASAGSQNGSSYTVTTSQVGAKTATVYARVTAGGVTCQSANAANKTANVQAKPTTPTITASATTVCQNTNIVFRINQSAGANATYTWAGPAGTASGGANSSYTVSGAATGTKQVSVTASVPSGGVTCPSDRSATFSAVVAPMPDKPATPTHNGPKCAGTAITFTAVKPANATELDWAGSVTGSGTTKNTTTTAGNYSAQVRAYLTSSGTTCYSDWSGSTWSTINSNPSLSISSNPASTVAPSTNVAFTANNCSNCTYKWDNNSTAVTINKTSPSTGSCTASCTATDQNGCTVSANRSVTVQSTICPNPTMQGQTATPAACVLTLSAPYGAFQNFTPPSSSSTATLVDTRDCKSYKVVKIGTRWIMAQNLNYQKDLTFQANSANPSTGTGSNTALIGHYWCPGADGSTTSTSNKAGCDTWGALYSWETAMMVDGRWGDESHAQDKQWGSEPSYSTSSSSGNTNNGGRGNGNRGICPESWHVPTDAEWGNVLNEIETGTDNHNTSTGWIGTNAGTRSKSTCTNSNSQTSSDSNVSWYGGTAGTDAYGFRVLPAGYRYYDGSTFYSRGHHAIFWSSSAYSATNAWHREFYYNYATVYRGNAYRSYGFSVRCIRD